VSRRKKKVETPPVQTEPVAEVSKLPTMKIHEELGLVSHKHKDAFLSVRLVGVTQDCFIVLDEEHREEMEFSRATGHRRCAPPVWDFWHLPEEDLAVLNRSEWKR
jgi:hypothetical protein